jgi:DNA-binding transcriptional LysR family regulator
VGRNIRLTHAGEAFRTHAIAAMGQFKDLEALMADHVGLKRGRIDLAVVSTAKYFIPMLLVRFGKQFQGIDIQLKIDNRENILGLLARNEADLVVMGRAPADMDCVATPFATNPQAVLATPDHVLARRKKLPFSALADHGFVVREEGSGTRAAMERLFADNKTPLKVVMEMPSNETIKQAVMAGMGLSFLSLRTVRHELASGHIALVDIVGLPVMGHWYVTHLSQKKLSPAARAFKEFPDRARRRADGLLELIIRKKDLCPVVGWSLFATNSGLNEDGPADRPGLREPARRCADLPCVLKPQPCPALL